MPNADGDEIDAGDLLEHLRALHRDVYAIDPTVEWTMEYDPLADTFVLVHYVPDVSDLQRTVQVVERIANTRGVRSIVQHRSKGRGRRRSDGSPPTESLTTRAYVDLVRR